MRTLASTFKTRSEAEAAARRLEAIGITSERIVIKDVAEISEGPGATSPAGSVFVSVKVPTDQIEPVTEILKGGVGGQEAPAAAAAAPASAAPLIAAAPPPQASPHAAQPPRPPVPEPIASSRPLPRIGAEPEPHPSDIPAAPNLPPRTAGVTRRDHGRLGRYAVYYGLALVVAFIIGAWLGMAT